jgi:hypothetical protein
MPTLWEWVSIAIGVIGVLLGVVGFVSGCIFGVVGIAFAIYQTHAMRKQRDFFREKYSIRYKDVSRTVGNLTEHVIGACEIVQKDCIGKSRQCGILSENISSAMSLSLELIRFCERLDEEYKAEFHNNIDKGVAKHLEDISCRCVDVPGFNQSIQNPVKDIPVLISNS